MEFMYPVFTRMLGGVTVGDSGLYCCALVCWELLTPFLDFSVVKSAGPVKYHTVFSWSLRDSRAISLLANFFFFFQLTIFMGMSV